MKNLESIKIGQKVSYKSGASTYTGIVTKKKQDSLIVVDSEDGMKLWNAGGNVGSEVYADQVLKQ